MAGSRRIFNYTSDTGTKYLIESDESNYEAANAGATINPTQAELDAGNFIPKSIQPRYMVYRGASGTTIKVVIAERSRVVNAPATLAIDAGGSTVTVYKSFYRGESTRGPFNS